MPMRFAEFIGNIQIQNIHVSTFLQLFTQTGNGSMKGMDIAIAVGPQCFHDFFFGQPIFLRIGKRPEQKSLLWRKFPASLVSFQPKTVRMERQSQYNQRGRSLFTRSGRIVRKHRQRENTMQIGSTPVAYNLKTEHAHRDSQRKNKEKSQGAPLPQRQHAIPDAARKTRDFHFAPRPYITGEQAVRFRQMRRVAGIGKGDLFGKVGYTHTN